MAEGAGLLSSYRVKPIPGSNPGRSAREPLDSSGGFLFVALVLQHFSISGGFEQADRLLTHAPDRCMYLIVVVRSACPASSWIAFAGAPLMAR